MVQPPGIAIWPMADMAAHQTIVPAPLAAKSSAERPRKARRDARSEDIRAGRGPKMAPGETGPRSALVVLVMAAPPEPLLVAAPGRAVEPLVHAPERVEAARIGGVGVVEGAVFEHER